ncbi:hypothetical protein [Lacinutrix sp.]|uniref:hypothetical protein n=1 Tax=Lacinutrix sp. TaxID=1937692 RepID=UPI0035C7EC4F
MILKSLKLFSKNTIGLLIILMTVFACQDEITEITPPNDQETIIENSNLAIIMQNTAALDGSLDNILDSANCILINLPVTITVNGVDLIIDSEEDYEVVEAIFDEFDSDIDDIEFLFPITITLNDYTVVTITNDTELGTFIEECSGENEEDDDIECIDFQYPITFSIYDANFQVTETVTINNDEALYNFIENLEGGVLASLNFPVTMILSDGSTVEVNNNQELEITISEAEDDCDEDDDNDWNDDDCTQDSIEIALQACIWNIVNYNGNSGSIIDKDFEFLENNQFTVTLNGNVVHQGTWTLTESNGSFVLTFDTNWDDIDGDWTIVECGEGILQLENGNNFIVMEQDCSINNPFECFEGEDFELTECAGANEFGTFNLTEAWVDCVNPNNFNVTYYFSLSDAQQEFNPIANPQAYMAISNPQTIYIRVELFNNSSEYQVFEIHLNTENCNTSGCSESDVDAYLVECTWNVVNYNASDDLITYDLDFQDNGVLIITGNGQTITSTWSTSETNDGVWVEFDGVNGPNIQAISGNWLVVECDPDRLQMDQGDITMVIEQECINSGMCTEGDVDGILMECEWQIALYNGSAGFNIFYIDFMDAQNLVIASPSESYSGNWTTSQNGDAVMLTISNISGGNVQVLDGDYVVVECSAEQIILHDVNNSDNEIVLDRYCN